MTEDRHRRHKRRRSLSASLERSGSEGKEHIERQPSPSPETYRKDGLDRTKRDSPFNGSDRGGERRKKFRSYPSDEGTLNNGRSRHKQNRCSFSPDEADQDDNRRHHRGKHRSLSADENFKVDDFSRRRKKQRSVSADDSKVDASGRRRKKHRSISADEDHKRDKRHRHRKKHRSVSTDEESKGHERHRRRRRVQTTSAERDLKSDERSRRQRHFRSASTDGDLEKSDRRRRRKESQPTFADESSKGDERHRFQGEQRHSHPDNTAEKDGHRQMKEQISAPPTSEEKIATGGNGEALGNGDDKLVSWSSRDGTDPDSSSKMAEGVDSKGKMVAEPVLGRAGGIYIPPFRLARMQKEIKDKSSLEYQKQAWEALRKSINGLVNKVNVGNIGNLVHELFRENLVRGRGLFARSVIRAQMASPGFTNVYAALLAVVNSKLPEVGKLVLDRVVLQFRRAYRRNDKIVCGACLKFLAHLVNQKVAHELLALQLAALMLEKVTDDSVEVCVGFMQEVGQILAEISPKGFNAVFERFRGILHEGEIDKRVQYTIEKLFDTRRKKFSDFPGVVSELDLVEEADQITHEIDLLDVGIRGEEMLNIFKEEEPEVFLENESKWSALSAEILGLSGDIEQDGEEGGGGSDTSEDSEDEEGDKTAEAAEEAMIIKDMTEQDVVNLRKTIYLCIMSSAGFEECVHKLLKLNIKSGCEIEVCTMLIDCCAMERTFQRFFALQAERLSRLSPIYQENFILCFQRQYQTVHRLETNKLRNTAKFFAHLLHTNALPWEILSTFILTEEQTSSASRIFIKIIFQELSEHLGIRVLNERLRDPELTPSLTGVFPTDHPKNVRFAINFFTAIGLGGLTDDLRELLASAQTRLVSSV